VAARLEERRTQAERALGYVELYGAYVETEARFDDRRLAALWETLPGADQAAFCFDPRTIDWAAYIRDVHLPSIVHHARVRTRPGAKGGLSRSDRGRRAVLAPERTLAVFDLENTLVASNVVESYSWLASRRMDTGQRVRFVARWRWTGATGATSSATSTAATTAPRPTGCGPTPGSCSVTCCWRSRSPKGCAGCGNTAGSATAPCC